MKNIINNVTKINGGKIIPDNIQNTLLRSGHNHK